jgi:hypothetical protein
MAAIRKFSFTYDVLEDRISCDMEDVEGQTTRLWLTHRLCRGLVSALVPLVPTAPTDEGAPGRAEALQSWEQAAAMAGFGKLSGVSPAANAASGLVRAVHIKHGAGMALTFEFTDGGSRVLPLEFPAVRQSLAVLRGLFDEAGWAADIWPAWISPPTRPAARPALN